MLRLEYVISLFFIFSLTSNAQENVSSTDIKDELTCISSNGVPIHDMGKFPNRANPNAFKEQELTFCFPTAPRLTEGITRGLMTVGVSISGIPIRPYTAEYFDPKSKRGYSRNPSSGWRKQAMHYPRGLGIDLNNGHVDKSGLYHYHGLAKSFNESEENILIGFAPDGFKIIYSPKGPKSSWHLKTGRRPSSPGGVYDGQFEEDFEYRAQSGSLDECNGTNLNGVYTYFATLSYPFFPRCFKGSVNLNFMLRR